MRAGRSKLEAASRSDIVRVADIGPVGGESVHQWFRNPRNKGILKRLAAAGVRTISRRALPAAPKPTAAGQPTTLAVGESAIRAPMPGIVIKYNVQEGQAVKLGDTVVILEAMKMENALPAPADGIVKKLGFKAGAKVAKGDILAVIG